MLSFSPVASYPLGLTAGRGGPQAMATADLNDDGHLDLITANADGNSISVLLGNGNGTFQAAQTYSTGAYPRSVAVGDFKGDGKLDVVTANAGSVYADGGGSLSILLGNGDGTFQAAQSIALPGEVPAGYPGPGTVPQTPLAVAVGDMNGDGKLDLTVSARAFASVVIGSGPYGNYYQTFDSSYVNVLVGNGSGGFSPASTTPVSALPLALTLADFNGDHKLDVLTSTSVSASVLLGNGNGTLGSPVGVNGLWIGSDTVPVGDFNKDGKPDLLLRDSTGNNLLVMTGNGDGTFQLSQTINVNNIGATVVGDVNGDGNLDVVITRSQTYYVSYGSYSTTESATVLLGFGDGSFAVPLTSTLGSQAGNGSISSAALGDFNGDGRVDLAAVDPTTLSATVALNDGNWTAVPPPPLMNIGDATVTEGDTGTVNSVFTVTLSKPSSQPVTVQYNTANGTADAGQDYVASSGTLTFQPGQTSTTLSVPVIGDLINEYNETFFVNLSGAANAQIMDGQGLGTIIDNDPPPSMAINNVTKNEGNSGYTSFTFTVSLSAPSEKGVSVNYTTADGTATTADKDYVAASGTLYFAAGQTSQTITVLVIGDTKKEADETFFVNLSGVTNAVLADSQGIGTILNDDFQGSKHSAHNK